MNTWRRLWALLVVLIGVWLLLVLLSPEEGTTPTQPTGEYAVEKLIAELEKHETLERPAIDACLGAPAEAGAARRPAAAGG